MYAHVNIWNDCLHIVKSAGWELRIEPERDEDDNPLTAPRLDQVTWIAEKGEFVLIGHTPVELLGLMALYDFRKPDQPTPYWWNIPNCGDIWEELMYPNFPGYRRGDSRGTEGT